jgi:MFS family permease
VIVISPSDTAPSADVQPPARIRRFGSPLHILAGSLFLLRLGAAMTLVGLPLMLLDRYGAGFTAGITMALQILPNVLLGPAIGALVDHTGPRRMAVAGPLLSAPAVALFAASHHQWQLQVLTLLAGLGYAVGVPARLALRSLVVEADRRVAGNGLLLAAQRLPLLIGPAAAGLLLSHGFTVLFLIDALSALLASLLLLALPARSHRPTEPLPPLWRLWTQSIPLALRAVTADRALAALTGTALTYMFAFGMTRLFLAEYVLSRFPGHAGFLGLLSTGMGIGAVLGSLTSSRLDRFRQGKIYLTATAVEGVCWLTLAVVSNLIVALAMLAIAGVCEAIGTVIFYSEAQARLPTDMEGRFFAILIGLTDLFMLVGSALAGVVVAVGIPFAASLIAAAMTLPVVFLLGVFMQDRYWPLPAQNTSAVQGDS